MFSIRQAMDDFFDNTGGGGAAYGGSGLSYGPITGGGGSSNGRSGGGSGGSGSKEGTDKLPYNPNDYRYHEYFPGEETHYNGRFYDEHGMRNRCDGWVTHRDPTESFPLPKCPKPIEVSWFKGYFDWAF
jgi:hypothetical protein